VFIGCHVVSIRIALRDDGSIGTEDFPPKPFGLGILRRDGSVQVVAGDIEGVGIGYLSRPFSGAL
jgi:hypothetical protein